MAFVFPSLAQDSFIEYTYLDSTKEIETLNPNRIEYKRSLLNEEYSISSINVDFVFDSLVIRQDLSTQVLVLQRMKILFDSAAPLGIQYPFSLNVRILGGNIDIDSKETTSNNRTIMAFNTTGRFPSYACHNGKQILSISGRLEYEKVKKISASAAGDNMRNLLYPFVLQEVTENNDGSTLKFTWQTKSSLTQELAVARVSVINNLKRVGYSLTSTKGVYPLIYSEGVGNTIKMYENYIEIGF